MSIYLLSLLLLLSFSLTKSQELAKNYVWKAPLITVNGSYSYLIPLQDLQGSVPEFFQFKNYGTRTGIAFNIEAKVAVNKKRNMRVYLSLGFAQSNRDDDNNIAYIDSNYLPRGYPLPGSSVYNTNNGDSRIVIRDLYAGIGIERTLAANKSMIPFLGIELALDYVYGYYVQTPYYLRAQKNFDIKGGFRGGFGINAGTDIRMLNSVGVIVGAKYRFANVIGKHSERTTDTDKFDFLDKASTDLNSMLNKDRNIGYLQFYLGLSVFLGFK